MIKCSISRDQWREFARTKAPALREVFIREYAVLARRSVERLQITPWGCVNKDDLLSHAIIGLIDAIDRFDPEQGTAFEAFAMPRIRGAVLDALRKLDWVPRAVRTDESRLRRTFGRLEARLGRTPTDDEVADDLQITREELDRLVTDVARGSVLSLDDLVAAGGDEGEEALGRPGLDPYRQQERAEASRRLAEAVRTLPEREQQVVSLYYYRELTLREIGLILNVSEQRVSQIHAKAMLRLSHKLTRHTALLATVSG